MQNYSRSQIISSFVVGIILFILIQPYFVWNWPAQLKLLIQAIPVILFIINNDFKNDKNSILLFALFLLLLLWTCLIQGYSIAFLLFNISFAIFPFVDKDYAYSTYSWFRKSLAVFLSISLIVWALVLSGVDVPYRIIEPLNTLKPYDYTQYPFLVIANELLSAFRFFGPFDEPGVMGTICAIILYVEKYNLRDPFNIPLLIAGLCTFSMFFILATIIYLSLKVIKKPQYVFLIALSIITFYHFTKDNDVFQELIYDRLEFDSSSKSFSGDNRATDDFKAYYNSIKGTSTYFFGADQKTIDRFSGNAGYRNAVIKYGFIFCFLYLIWFFYYAKVNRLRGRNMIIFIILMLTVLYQRPGFLDPVYIFLFSEYIKIHSLKKKDGIIYNSYATSDYQLL